MHVGKEQKVAQVLEPFYLKGDPDGVLGFHLPSPHYCVPTVVGDEPAAP